MKQQLPDNDKLKNWMQESGPELAPKGFSDRLMNRLALVQRPALPAPIAKWPLYALAAAVLLLIAISPLLSGGPATDRPEVARAAEAAENLGEALNQTANYLSTSTWFLLPAFLLLFYLSADYIMRKRVKE